MPGGRSTVNRPAARAMRRKSGSMTNISTMGSPASAISRMASDPLEADGVLAGDIEGDLARGRSNARFIVGRCQTNCYLVALRPVAIHLSELAIPNLELFARLQTIKPDSDGEFHRRRTFTQHNRILQFRFKHWYVLSGGHCKSLCRVEHEPAQCSCRHFAAAQHRNKVRGEHTVHFWLTCRQLELCFACLLIPLAPETEEVLYGTAPVHDVPVRVLQACCPPSVPATIHEQHDLIKVCSCT